jgi:hypothetical protein
MRLIVVLLSLTPLLAVGQERIVGLVEIPALHNRLNSGAPETELGPVTLFAEPNQLNASVVVRNWRELESREHGYEQVSAAVFGREPSPRGGFWYQLKYVSGDQPTFGWLNQTDAGQYRGIHSFIYSEGMTYLTDEWDGQVFEAPGDDAPIKEVSGLEERQGTRVIDIRSEGDQRWYLVAFVRGFCTGEPLEVVDTGWVRAYSESGGNAVWYFPRGC